MARSATKSLYRRIEDTAHFHVAILSTHRCPGLHSVWTTSQGSHTGTAVCTREKSSAEAEPPCQQCQGYGELQGEASSQHNNSCDCPGKCRDQGIKDPRHYKDLQYVHKNALHGSGLWLRIVLHQTLWSHYWCLPHVSSNIWQISIKLFPLFYLIERTRCWSQ